MTTSPREVTVQVSNSTAQAGLAAIASNQLKRNGFNVMTPDDYPSSLTDHHGVLLPRQRTGRRHRGFRIRRIDGRAGHRSLGRSFR